MSLKVPEKYRVTTGQLQSDASYGNNGYFFIPKHGGLNVIVSDQEGWEHVSVSRMDKHDVPSWYDLVLVKNMFWDESDTVVQFLPKKSAHRSIGEVLHLWRKIGHEYDLPPGDMVEP